MAGRDVKTQKLSRRVLKEIVRLEDPRQERWVSRNQVGEQMGLDPDVLYDPVHLLIQEGDLEKGSSDLWSVRATMQGRRKVPRAG